MAAPTERDIATIFQDAAAQLRAEGWPDDCVAGLAAVLEHPAATDGRALATLLEGAGRAVRQNRVKKALA